MNHKTKIEVKNNSPERSASDGLVLFVAEKDPDALQSFRKVNAKLSGKLLGIISDEKFRAKVGDLILYHTNGAIPSSRVILCGVGKKEKWNAEVFRRAAGAAAIEARNAGCRSLTFCATDNTGMSRDRLASVLMEGALLGAYRYVRLKTKEEEIESEKRLDKLVFLSGAEAALRKSLNVTRTYVEATMRARDLVNDPANDLSPKRFMEQAKKVARETGLGIRILEVPELKKLGAGGILGVGMGSAVPPRMIELSYKCGKKNAQKTALVGKGITFDSGGLSLKPSKYMETMKCDMAGAAAVLCAMSALPSLKPARDVIGILCVAENMPSGSALRPGDVLRAINGKTIEIINTDAEGRLVLADGLSWAVRQKANEIIDLATLTGACVVGLGPYVAGIMGNDEPLMKQLIQAGEQTGEVLWQLPVPEDYDFILKSDIADVKNLGPNSEAGAIQGAMFLKEFVGDTRWAHLDIAGPAWYEKDFYHIRKNGTGFGVRTLLKYLCG